MKGHVLPVVLEALAVIVIKCKFFSASSEIRQKAIGLLIRVLQQFCSHVAVASAPVDKVAVKAALEALASIIQRIEKVMELLATMNAVIFSFWRRK